MTDEDDWADFIEFLGRAPAAFHPGVLFDGFRRDLIGRGVPDADAVERMRRVMATARQRNDPSFAATIGRALRPGGVVVVESFALDESRPRRPVDLEPEQLRAAYGHLREVAFAVEETVADWTLERAGVVRLATERP